MIFFSLTRNNGQGIEPVVVWDPQHVGDISPLFHFSNFYFLLCLGRPTFIHVLLNIYNGIIYTYY